MANLELQKKLMLASLEPLFKEAIETSQWVFNKYNKLWFTPEELKGEIEKGNFLDWGMKNWELKSPGIRVEQLLRNKKIAEEEYIIFCKKVSDWVR